MRIKKIKYSIVFIILPLTNFVFGQDTDMPNCIGEKISYHSEILKHDRDIFISLPKKYDKKKNYPVHYILDGEFYFQAYSGIVHTKSLAEEIPETIVVGISNHNRQVDLDTREHGNGVNFLNFLRKELVPYIDSRFGTDKDRVLIGYSLAGYFTIYTFLDEQHTFNKFIAGSPYGLFLFDQDKVDHFLKNLKIDRALYTSMGNEDEPVQFEFFKSFTGYLKSVGKEYDLLDFKSEIISGRDHDNNAFINWQDGLDHLYKDWKRDKESD